MVVGAQWRLSQKQGGITWWPACHRRPSPPYRHRTTLRMRPRWACAFEGHHAAIKSGSGSHRLRVGNNPVIWLGSCFPHATPPAAFLLVPRLHTQRLCRRTAVAPRIQTRRARASAAVWLHRVVFAGGLPWHGPLVACSRSLCALSPHTSLPPGAWLLQTGSVDATRSGDFMTDPAYEPVACQPGPACDRTRPGRPVASESCAASPRGVAPGS